MNSNPRLPSIETTGNWIQSFRERFYRLWREHADEHAQFEPQYGEWTPVLTFATPGNLAVSYSVQMGRYTRIGKQMFVDFKVVTASYTQTTASGSLQLTGLPLAPANVTNYQVSAACEFSGINKVNFTQVTATALAGSTTVSFDASEMGIAVNGVTAADVPSGGSVILIGSLTYRVD